MKKKTYSQPQSAVTRVELESPICSGSAVITNPDKDYGRIEAQEVNSGFGFDDSQSPNNGWTTIE